MTDNLRNGVEIKLKNNYAFFADDQLLKCDSADNEIKWKYTPMLLGTAEEYCILAAYLSTFIL
jgi:hypothetical protein